MKLYKQPRKPGHIVKRKIIIGRSKILNPAEQKAVYLYLNGQVRGLDGLFVKTDLLSGARALIIYQLMLCTGIRAEELCDLRVMDTPKILGDNFIAVYRGKNNRDREIPVSKKMAQALTLYIDIYRPKTMPRHHRRNDLTKPVFYSHIKRKLTPNALTKLFYRIGIQAGLAKRLHPHMLRHTFAVNSLRNGVNIYTVKELMGHSDLNVTSGYLHLVDDYLKGLGEQLDFSTNWQ